MVVCAGIGVVANMLFPAKLIKTPKLTDQRRPFLYLLQTL